MLSFNINAAITNFACNGSKYIFDIQGSFTLDFYSDGLKVGYYTITLQEASTLFITQSKEGYTLKRFDDNHDVADFVFITVTDSCIYLQELL